MPCRKGLLEAVKSGDIDIISSDHSPAPADLKETQSGDFLKAWGGISGETAVIVCIGQQDGEHACFSSAVRCCGHCWCMLGCMGTSSRLGEASQVEQLRVCVVSRIGYNNMRPWSLQPASAATAGYCSRLLQQAIAAATCHYWPMYRCGTSQTL
jgi:hypothetical protein